MWYILWSFDSPEAIFSIMTKIEKIFICKCEIFCHLMGQIQSKLLYKLVTYGPTGSLVTGKSLSEALILVSTNPQYDNGLFIELRVQQKLCTQHVLNL